jgi:uncharacterized membrane protein
MDPSTLRGDDPEDRNPFHGELPTAQGPLFGAVQRFFTGGNAWVRMGTVLGLLLGIALLVRYAMGQQ